jgi:DnaJ-class molecular chaperone
MKYQEALIAWTPHTYQMPLARAMELLGVPVNYTRDDVIAAFRRAAKKAHPDMGGTAEISA